MNTKIEDIQEETEVYVIYVPNEGFASGRTTQRFTKEFSKARVYTRECDADNSVKMWDGFQDKNALVVPVKLTLDKKKLFQRILLGK